MVFPRAGNLTAPRARCVKYPCGPVQCLLTRMPRVRGPRGEWALASPIPTLSAPLSSLWESPSVS